MSQLQIVTLIDWREPLWLLLALQPLLLWWLHRRWRQRHIDAYAEPALQPWVIPASPQTPAQRTHLRTATYVLAWLLFAIAAAGPRLQLDNPHTPPTGTADIVLAVDISASMAATDIRPNRLRRAQIEIAEFLQHAPGQRVGILLFAARAHTYVPLTSDYAALRFYLQSLDSLQLPTEGTRPVEALKLAEKLLNEPGRKSAIVLLSDADWPEPVSWDNASIPLYILGLGSEDGAAIPRPSGEWLIHDGQPVISRMDSAALDALTKKHAGRYSPASDDDSDWQQLYDHGMARHFSAPDEPVDAQTVVWRELYTWALLPGILLLWLSLLPTLRTSRKIRRQTRPRNRRSGTRGSSQTTILLIPLLIGPTLLTSTPQAAAANLEQQAWRHYQQGDYPAALRLYKQLPGASGRLGEGAALYRQAVYPEAIRVFTRAVLLAEDDTTRGRALFNLGNSYFQSGAYAKAAAVFRDALLYRPHHEASQFNLQFSRALQAAVEQRLQQARVARHAGTGPQRARAGEDMALAQSGALSLGDAESRSDKPRILPELPDLSATQLAALIEKGLTHIRLADDANDDRRAAQQRQFALAEARQRMQALQDRQAPLWKRLFEMEEGFPASLQKPREMPGVRPW